MSDDVVENPPTGDLVYGGLFGYFMSAAGGTNQVRTGGRTTDCYLDSGHYAVKHSFKAGMNVAAGASIFVQLSVGGAIVYSQTFINSGPQDFNVTTIPHTVPFAAQFQIQLIVVLQVNGKEGAGISYDGGSFQFVDAPAPTAECDCCCCTAD